MYQKGFAYIQVIFGILILGICLVGGYFVISKNLLFAPSTTNTQDQLAYTPPPCYTKFDPESASLLRQVDTASKFLGNQVYPVEITSYCDSDLVVLDCLDPYNRTDDGNYVYNQVETTETGIKSTSLKVTQEDTLDNIDRLTRKLEGRYPDRLKLCLIRDTSDLIAEYEHLPKSRETDRMVGFATIVAQGGVNLLPTIPNDNLINFSCDQPVLFTKSYIFYFECHGESDSSVSKYIYKTDLNEGVTTKIIQCSTTGTNVRGEDNVVCQPT